MVSGGFDLRALRRDYGDVHAEASSCRSAAALFDFSFMSRIRVEGRAAAELIGALTPRRIDDLPSGRIRYALRVAADGRVLSDLTIWRLGAETFEIFDGLVTRPRSCSSPPLHRQRRFAISAPRLQSSRCKAQRACARSPG
jgi:glycine cleavage system aminomethyltransferase T